MADKWIPGGRVTISVDGTPMQGEVVVGPNDHDDASHFRVISPQSWVVKVLDFGNMRCTHIYFEVVGRKAIKELSSREIQMCIENRNGFLNSLRR